MKNQLTVRQARKAAKFFVEGYVDTDRQWNLGDIGNCLPRGWAFDRNVEQGDLYPPSINTIAAIIRAHAIEAD